MYRAKKLLRTHNDTQDMKNKIYINGDLLDTKQDLLRAARYYQKKLFFTYVRLSSCKTFVKGADSHPEIIKSISELRALIHAQLPGENVQIICRHAGIHS